MIPLKLPSTFDPAPLLYPPAITLLASLLIATKEPRVVVPNIILSLSSIPQQVVPKLESFAIYDTLHWIISCLPLVLHSVWIEDRSHSTAGFFDSHSQETLVLLYPLHRTLCAVLAHLTTTSLLTAELQLLSVALIDIFLLAVSPQVQILKGLLWIGGLGVMVLCGAVIRWGVALARVPKWRLQRPRTTQKSFWKTVMKTLSWHKFKHELLRTTFEDTIDGESVSTDGDDEAPSKMSARAQSLDARNELPSAAAAGVQYFPIDTNENGITKRHSLGSMSTAPRRRTTHTPSGRRKRAMSLSVRPYLRLTSSQATWRKWVFAGYVYTMILAIIFAGVRSYVQQFALGGEEPIGWALGYLFGNLPWFRFQVVSANLERWILLPVRNQSGLEDKECHMGWVQHVRHDYFGEANTRLLLSAYWLGVVAFGLIIVLQLKESYEVDTRRKVFHFMMVGMFLPTIYVDPAYAALALSLMLAIFLILDLLRASQLPPLSKPIAFFLAPYVDGRDLRGPVVISHIFLLIGCAIPFWLALAALPRSGSGSLAGWEVPVRDISMVSGVVCVGLGDAAASLIGRRYGHRKWLWGGGKSLEGSAAFVAAVFVGLSAASLWLRIGGWPRSGQEHGLAAEALNIGICASIASLNEAVLTGGNDNVIVPVVLWMCVKSLGL